MSSLKDLTAPATTGDDPKLGVTVLERMLGVTAKRWAECEQHGPYVSTHSQRTKSWAGCPDCHAATKTKEEVSEVGQRIVRASSKAAAAFTLDIPARYQGVGLADWIIDQTFDEADQKRQRLVRGHARWYVDEWAERLQAGSSLLFTGGVGTGKTMLACAMAHEVRERYGASVAYVTVGNLLNMIRDNWTTRRFSSTGMVEQFVQPQLLILDEVMPNENTDDIALLTQVLDARYLAVRPTVYIGNITKNQVTACLGERAANRLAQNMAGILSFTWGTQRKPLAKKLPASYLED